MATLVGKTIADYQITEVIDDGAKALVYKGIQPSTNRYTAIKVLKPTEAKDPAAVQAFSGYAERAAGIQHPNILPVLDSGEQHGLHYLITPFMENRSVAENLSLYRDLNQANSLIRGITTGLEVLFNQGTVHGNLRPSNIILDPQRSPLLADFGIPLRQAEASTPYHSPEQTQGGVVDQRTDVYALGVLLYTLLAGRAPDPGTVASISVVRPDVPQSVEQVIQKAMAQSPDQRFQTPREFQNALVNAVQVPAPQPAAPPPQTVSQTVTVQESKKGPNWVAIILGGIIVVLICVCVSLAAPRVMEVLNPQATQPVEVKPIEPQPEERPTREPIELPERPPEQPPEQPPPEQPPEAGQPPEEAPAGETGGINFPGCTGSLGAAGGIVLMGGALSIKRRKRS
jgi:serine/threonine protein kinase